MTDQERIHATLEDAPRYPGALDLFGFGVHPVKSAQILDYARSVINASQRAIIAHINVHGANLAVRLPWMRRFFNRAQIVFCDGDGIRWALRVFGATPPPKVTYSVWLWELAGWCSANGFPMYLLGGKPGVSELAARNLRERHPALKIVGHHHGYFARDGAEDDALIAEINRADPDVLIVCLGMPIQEAWIVKNAARLSPRVIFPAGAAMDYAAGIINLTPRWIASLNLEWLYRFLHEPLRLFRRYIFGNPLFAARVFLEWSRRRRRARTAATTHSDES